MIAMETEMELDDYQGMTDYQKLQLTQVSYLDFDMEEAERLRGMKFSDAEQYLSSPDSWAIGIKVQQDDNHWMNRASDAVAKCLTQECYTTEQQLYDRCIDAGIGDYTIKDIVSDKETGFQAIALEDKEGNVYFSFRGSDLDLTKGGLQDWVQADGAEMFKGDKGDQVRQAVEFFDKNKSETGQNAVFGHSLGGNLTSHVFAQRHDEISQAFAYNPNPISERLLDTPEKQQAFQSSKFTIALTEGDWASAFKSFELYENRAVYIKNAIEEPNAVQNHLAESASFDKNGNFVKSDKEAYLAAQEEHPRIQALTEFIHNTDKIMRQKDAVADLIADVRNGQWPDNLEKVIQQMGQDAAQWINGVRDQFFINPVGLDVITPTELFQQYNDMLIPNQQMQQPEFLLDEFGQTMQAQDTMYIQPEQLMSMSGSMMGMDPTMQGMDGMSMFQTISQTVGQMEGMGQSSSDGLMSWGDNADVGQDMEIDEEMDQEGSMEIKFHGMN